LRRIFSTEEAEDVEDDIVEDEAVLLVVVELPAESVTDLVTELLENAEGEADLEAAAAVHLDDDGFDPAAQPEAAISRVNVPTEQKKSLRAKR